MMSYFFPFYRFSCLHKHSSYLDVKNTHIPLLFLANKMDLDGAIDPTESWFSQ